MSVVAMPVGDHLREWRLRRRMSQLDLACEAEISTRHLSFVETGRSTPSREMILHLAEQLDIPMRERNVLLVAAGYAPLFPERALAAPELKAAREAIELLLEGHKPYPAFALDRHWNVVASNAALPEMFEGVDARLLEPPVNAMRLSLHPNGLAPKILNLPEWRAHLLARLRRQIDLTADPALIELLEEVQAYGKGLALAHQRPSAPAEMVIPFRLRIASGVISFFSTTMVFGTPVEVTLS
jgi:transcriptional regulator with XRE-family HTH domain